MWFNGIGNGVMAKTPPQFTYSIANEDTALNKLMMFKFIAFLLTSYISVHFNTSISF